MRLAYVAYSALDLQSANSIQTFLTLRELNKQLGAQLSVLVPRFGNESAPFPVRQLRRIPVNKLSRVYRSGYWSYFERAVYAERARRILASAKPDLIYTRDLVCAYRFVRAGMPVLYEVHDLAARHPSETRTARLQELLSRADDRTVRQARGLVSLTDTFRQEVLAAGWQPPERIFVIPDAYDDAVYSPRDRDAARTALVLPSAAKLVAYAGMTFKYRGLDVLLRALQTWGDPQARLALVGGRDFELTELRNLAAQLGVTGRVDFVGRKSAHQVVLYLAAADVLVIPDTVTDATASPLKMFEYMAMARPIVALDRPALREILGDAALYFPRGDARALASALARAALPESAALGERALALASQYTYARRAAKIVDAAQKIIQLDKTA